MSVDTLIFVGTTISQKTFCSSASELNPDQQLKRGLLRTDVRLFASQSWVHGRSITNSDEKISLKLYMSTQTYIYYINNIVPFDFFSHPSCYFTLLFLLYLSLSTLPNYSPGFWVGFFFFNFPLQITFTLLFPSLLLLPLQGPILLSGTKKDKGA